MLGCQAGSEEDYLVGILELSPGSTSLTALTFHLHRQQQQRDDPPCVSPPSTDFTHWEWSVTKNAWFLFEHKHNLRGDLPFLWQFPPIFLWKLPFHFSNWKDFMRSKKIHLQLWCLFFTCNWCWLLFHLYLMLVESSAKPFAALEMSVSTTGFTSFAFKVSKSELYQFWMKLRSLWIILCFMCFPKDGSVLSSGLTIVTHVTQM